MELRKVLREYKEDVWFGVIAGAIIGIVSLVLLKGMPLPSFSSSVFSILVVVPFIYLMCSIPSNPRKIARRLVSDASTSIVLALVGAGIAFYDLPVGIYCIVFAFITWAVRYAKLTRALRNAMPNPGLWD